MDAGVDDDCAGVDTLRIKSAKLKVAGVGVDDGGAGGLTFASSWASPGGKVGGACCCGEGITGGGADAGGNVCIGAGAGDRALI